MNKEEIVNEQDANEVNNPENNTENTEQGDFSEKLTDNTTEKTAEEKYAELYDNYLRLFSEFDNFRKRNAKERLELIKIAGSDILRTILPILDDLERAIKNFDSSDVETLKQGTQLIYTKLKHALGDKGLVEMNPIGENFDSDQHEAITQLPAPDEKQKGKILDVIEKGYKLNDVIIRYPKVVVYI